jgi:hydrogenase/urease accessory protein HupE
MNPVAADPPLAHLLEVQGGLLDAYLKQNLGKRFAYAIFVVPVDLAGAVVAVSNVHAPMVELGADFIARQLQTLKPGAELDVDAEARVVASGELPWNDSDADA